MKSITASLLLALGMVGCKKSFQSTETATPEAHSDAAEASSNAEYVRIHHCGGGRHHDTSKPNAVVDGKEVYLGVPRPSYTAYDCPNGITVYVDDPSENQK